MGTSQNGLVSHSGHLVQYGWSLSQVLGHHSARQNVSGRMRSMCVTCGREFRAGEAPFSWGEEASSAEHRHVTRQSGIGREATRSPKLPAVPLGMEWRRREKKGEEERRRKERGREGKGRERKRREKTEDREGRLHRTCLGPSTE